MATVPNIWRIWLRMVMRVGRVSVSRRPLQVLSPLVWEAVSRMVELVLSSLGGLVWKQVVFSYMMVEACFNL